MNNIKVFKEITLRPKSFMDTHSARVKNCPICQSTHISFFASLPSSYEPSRTVSFSRCHSCQALFDSSLVLVDYEETGVDQRKLYLELNAGIPFFAFLMLKLEKVIKNLEPTPSGPLKMLEVGCGYGLLLDLARFRGWEVTGVEPNKDAIQWAKTNLGLDLIGGYLENSDLPKDHFDAIIASEVIEHLADPRPFLRMVHSYLNDKGVFLLSTPHSLSQDLLKEGEKWGHLFPSAHLIIYSPTALKNILEETGFARVSISTAEGRTGDERLISFASKRPLPRSPQLDTHPEWAGRDPAILKLAIAYCADLMKRLPKENSLWLGAAYRSIGFYHNLGQYEQALHQAKRLEAQLTQMGYTSEKVLATAETLWANRDANYFITQLPTFIDEFYFIYGASLFSLNRASEAIEYFSRAYQVARAIENLPLPLKVRNVPLTLNSLAHQGYAYLQLNKPKQALECFETVLTQEDKLSPDLLEDVLLKKGMVLLQLGENKKALSCFGQLRRISQRPHIISQTISLQQSLSVWSNLRQRLSLGRIRSKFLLWLRETSIKKFFKMIIPTRIWGIIKRTSDQLISHGLVDKEGRKLVSPVILAGDEYGQVFQTEKEGLASISLEFATDCRTNTCQIEFGIKPWPISNDISPFRTMMISASELKDNQFYQFEFPPLPFLKGTKLYLYLKSPDASPGNAVRLWCRPSKKSKYSALINNQRQPFSFNYHCAYKTNNHKRILILCPDTIGKTRIGIGMRHWEIGLALAQKGFQVSIITPQIKDGLPEAQNNLSLMAINSPTLIKRLVKLHDIIIFQGDLFWQYPFLTRVKKPLVIDLVCPLHIEELQKGNPKYYDFLSLVNNWLKSGSFFICGNETQRSYYLGMLTAMGKINPEAMKKTSHNFRSYIDVVSFGIPREPPLKTKQVLKGVYPGIQKDDIILLWWGGIWDWLDPSSLIKGLAQVSKDCPQFKLFFSNLKRPQGDLPEKARECVNLTKHLGLYERQVFFNEYPIPYEKRADYLLEADIGVYAQTDNLETLLAARTRGADYLWARLPIICTKGDDFSHLVEKYQLGATVDFDDESGWARAILKLSDPEQRNICRQNIEKIIPDFYWDKLIEPLAQWCQLV